MTQRHRARPPENADILLFNKPYQVLSQFSGEPGQKTLADWVPFGDIYAAGRLDADSEGLLVLTANGQLQAYIAHPKHKMQKTYWAQVEGIPSAEALDQLRAGVDIGDYVTERCEAQMIDTPPNLWPRNPPIRTRLSIPTSWLEIKIREGKNRQVRRMTAKIGHPTLRLIRAAVGSWSLSDLQPGQWRWVTWQDKPTLPRQNQHNRQNRSHAKPAHSTRSYRPSSIAKRHKRSTGDGRLTVIGQPDRRRNRNG